MHEGVSALSDSSHRSFLFARLFEPPQCVLPGGSVEVFVGDTGWRMTEEQLAIHVVFKHIACRAGFIWITLPRSGESSRN